MFGGCCPIFVVIIFKITLILLQRRKGENSKFKSYKHIRQHSNLYFGITKPKQDFFNSLNVKNQNKMNVSFLLAARTVAVILQQKLHD